MNEPTNLSRPGGSVLLARCPSCSSHAVKREPGGTHHGPMDTCERCGHRFSAKPSSVTVHQHVASMNGGAGEPAVMMSLAGRSLNR